MNEEEALNQSSGSIDKDGLEGYFFFSAASYLIRFGSYEFYNLSVFGYILKRLEEG